MIDFNDSESSFIRSLALNCLAYPAGLVKIFNLNFKIHLFKIRLYQKVKKFYMFVKWGKIVYFVLC